MYKNNNIKALFLSSQFNKSFEHRLFAAYLLYKMNPTKYSVNFAERLPKTEQQYIAYVSIPSNLIVDQGSETYEVSMKGVPWPISFWAIHSAACTLARKGSRTCIRSVLALSRFGDGEIGEGMSENAMLLFDTPATVVKHWDLFESHIDFLSSFKDHFTDSQLETIRQAYGISFSKMPATLKRILELIEKGER